MEDNNIEANKMRIDLDALPAVFAIQGFTAIYHASVKSNPKEKFWSMLAIVFGCIFIASVLTIFIGPDQLYIQGDMSLSEFWQLYPGPIASVSFVLIYGCIQIASQFSTNWKSYFSDMIDVYVDSKIIDATGYEIETLENDNFVIAKDPEALNNYINKLRSQLQEN
ncbi:MULTISPECIES: hypothetical protein [unclassified Pseudoalteromonas]|nr:MULTISPECIES: hypothetical protein [unclassified Pseudoalteromonas]MBB1279077.1 hypothetical protein [Pseudoalteromonas sp. SR41-1]GAA68418.1 hypothetical protein P20429_2545 [Pseudoalteromonas sp. BSi20429]